MSYRLKYDPGVEAVHDALPPAASQTLMPPLADACHDPIAATVPYGEDDGVMRMLVTEQAFAVLLIGETLKTVTVLQITWLG